MKLLATFFFITFITLMTSCYRFPEEGEYSTQPTTNNPAVTLQKQDSFLPAIGY